MVRYAWFVEFVKFANGAGEWFFVCGGAGEIKAEYFHKAFTRALQLGHDVFADGTEGGKDALAFKGNGLEVGNTATVEVAIEDVYR